MKVEIEENQKTYEKLIDETTDEISSFIEKANFEEANPLSTPEHIAPVWYYSPYYAMLRAVPDKLGGLIVMAGAIVNFICSALA